MAVNGDVFLADAEVQVDEAAGTLMQRIVRTGSLENRVKITYNITSDTAVAGEDFVGGIGTIRMRRGAAEVSVPIQVQDDALVEGNETFVFSLVSLEGADLSVPRTSRITILDDESPEPPPDPEPPLASDYTVTQIPVVEGLNQPIKFEFSPLDSSRAYIAEKGGIIRVADMTNGTTSVLLDISGRVNENQDRGLLDIALHPDFAGNPYIYAFFVVDPPGTASQTGNAGPDGGGNRYAQVSRFTADAATGYTTIVAGSEVVLVGNAGRSLNDISGGGQDDFTDPVFDGVVASDRYINSGAPPQTVIDGFKQNYIKVDSITHAGGGLVFGPDGALYVSIGDGTSPNFADPRSVDVLDLDSLSGKILRIDPLTGRGLEDNPFADDGVALTSNRAKVFQSGVRNPFSVAFDEEGRLFITNTGWNSYEAILTGGPGANFGWPFYEGGDGGVLLQTPEYRSLPAAAAFYDAVASGDIVVTPAFRAFSHNSADPGFQVQGITGGSMVYSGDVYPVAFKDDYFFTDFAGGEVYTVDVKDRTELKFLYQTEDGAFGPVDYVQGPDGYIYYVDLITGQIGRYDIVEGAPPPPPPPRPPVNITIGNGPDTLELRISQDEYAGDAQYTVSVDGVQVNGILTAAAERVSGLFDTVTVLGTWAPGGHTVTINFLNDAYGGANGLDRNLFLNGASYNGTVIPDLQLGLTATGPASFDFTDTGAPPSGGSTTTIGSGPDTLVLRISQDVYQGDARYTVSVDGVQVNGTLTAQALHSGGASDTVNVLGTWAPGSHSVSINFLNDAWGGSAATDRNLYLDGATYNGTTVAGATAVFAVEGAQAFGFTDVDGPPATGGSTTTIGSGADRLVLRISQDAYQGNAQYTVSVDGVQVNGTLTAQALHSSGESDTVNVRGTWAPGSHSVSINFLNDAWDGSAATDRNLYLDRATYNGAAVAGATAVFEVDGPQVFSFNDVNPIA